MLKVFISEDEPKTLNSIISIIENYCSGINISGYAQSVKEAVAYLNNHEVDLLLLDVNFPDGTAFDILSNLNAFDKKVIFITAHEKYAIQAIKLSASDYLLKPLDPKELISSIEKVKSELKKEPHLKENLATLLANLQTTEKKKKKIVLKTHERIHVIEIANIIRCESDSSYTTFILNNSKKILVSKNLKEYDELLNEQGFIRTHKSHLVNSDHIKSFEKNTGYLIMKDDSKIPVSVRRKEFVLNAIEVLLT